LAYDLAVPLEAELLQGAQDFVCGAWNYARSVEIFDPEQPLTARGAGLQVAACGGE
jgi:hypothetical protein